MYKEKLKKYILILLQLVIPLFGLYKFYMNDFNEFSGIFLMVFLIVYYILYKNYNKSKDKREEIFISILSIIYSLISVYGTIIHRHQDYIFFPIFKDSWFYNIIYLYSFYCLFKYLLSLLIKKFTKLKQSSLNINKKNTIIISIGVFLILISVYLVYFYIFYPGLLSPDSFSQLSQAYGNSDLSNHHPIMHTLLIKLCLSIGSQFGGHNIQIATYMLIQMFISTIITTYFINYIIKNNCNKYLLYFAISYYALNPIFGFYVMTMWKDVLFGYFVLLLMIQLDKLSSNKELANLDIVLAFISCLLVGLFRSNGTIILVILSITLILLNKNRRKQVIIMYLIPTILCFIITGPVYTAFNIKKGNLVESLSIPLGQISYVVASDNYISPKTEKYLNKLVGVDVIKEKYNPISIDGIKFDQSFKNEFLQENLGEFFKIWAKLLIKYPTLYIEGYLKSTYGFWYYESLGYTGHIWTIDKNMYKIKNSNPKLASKLFEIHNKILDRPIAEFLMKPAPIFIILIYTITCVFIKKKINLIYPLLLPTFMWVTIMVASPVNYQARYVFSLFTTLPFILYILLKIFKKNERVKKVK